jgi:hypothetical protein
MEKYQFEILGSVTRDGQKCNPTRGANMSTSSYYDADEIVKSAMTLEQDQTPAAALRGNRPSAGDTELIAARIAQRLRDAGFVFEVLEPPAVE